MTNEDRIKEYTTNPVKVRAVLLTTENAMSVAVWCGGDMSFESGPWGYGLSIAVPHGESTVLAEPGDFVVKLSTGKFQKYTWQEFESLFTLD